ARPKPIPAGETIEYRIDLHTNAHVFKAGHRIMVQVQSTLFPLIDRNPQSWVPSIYDAKASDYVKATQRIHRSRSAASAGGPAAAAVGGGVVKGEEGARAGPAVSRGHKKRARRWFQMEVTRRTSPKPVAAP